MSGPWAKYQPAQSAPAGPWAKYSPAQSRAAADAVQGVGHGTNDAGPFMAFMNGRTFNVAPQAMGAAAAFNTAIDNLGRTITGKPKPYGASDAYEATAAEARREAALYESQHPGANLALNAAGAVTNPVNAAAAEWAAGAKGVVPAMLRGVAVGAPTGAAYGAGGAAPGHRLAGAAIGAGEGAAFGVAAPTLGAVAGKTAGLAAGVGRNVQRAVGVADPQQVAANRLAALVAKDVKAGRDPQANAANWAGNSSPTLADVAGENLRAGVREAGSKGPARNTLQTYRDTVAANLQDHAQAITQKLTPGETRSPQQLADALTQTRSANAATNYAEPYAAPIQLDDRAVIQALRDPEGASAISRAVAGARANMDYGAVADLQALKNTAAGPTGDSQVWPTTGRALDRVQIALGNRGQQLTQGGSRDIGAGMFKRQALVNGLLDETPGLSEARGDYRNLSQQIEAIEHGQKVTTAPPSMLADLLAGATPDHLSAAGVGGRDALMTAIGAPTESAVGTLNKLSTNTNTGRNMEMIYGPDATQGWREGIQAEAGRMSNANYLAPNTGSQTASKASDGLADLVAHGGHAALGLAKAVLGGGPLSDAEREAMVNATVGDLSPELLSALMKPKAQPQLAPRAAYSLAPLLSASGSPGT